MNANRASRLLGARDTAVSTGTAAVPAARRWRRNDWVHRGAWPRRQAAGTAAVPVETSPADNVRALGALASSRQTVAGARMGVAASCLLGAPASSRQTAAGARVGDSRHRGRDAGRQDAGAPSRHDAGQRAGAPSKYDDAPSKYDDAPSKYDDAPKGGAIARGLAACLAGYLYGSLPFVYLLGRRHGTDLHGVGSGNVGSANLWAASGTAYGALGWVLDASKGGLPVALGRRLGCTGAWAACAGVCGVAGQCWPLFLRFNGGRGVSAFIGAAFMIDRARWTVALLPFIAGGLWRAAPLAPWRDHSGGPTLRTSRGKSVPLGCAAGVVTFAVTPLLDKRRLQGTVLAPLLLAAVVLLRRATAPLPDDATCGPRVYPGALLYRLLYDRNTSR